jgi:hypothetical protein
MGELTKVTAKTAAEICRKYTPEKASQALLTESQTPQAFLDALLAAGERAEARRFLAHALPTRNAIWWAVQALSSVVEPELPKAQTAALQASRAWVADPSEANRRAAWDAAEAARFDNPAGLSALAVFFTGGSLAPVGLPPVPPAAHLAGDAAANAMTLASLQREPEKAAAKDEAFLALGLKVAADTIPFPVTKAAAPRN